MVFAKFGIFLFLTITLENTQALSLRDNPRAVPCDPYQCRLPHCRCSTNNIPGDLSPKDTPQFVLLTFDDGVTVGNFPYYQEAFLGRRNRDGCPVAATYFVSHEYTNYQMVNQLYNQGHEIALHSITHNTTTDYWRTLSVDQLAREFADERRLISKFAGIPLDEMQGIRLPFLQMSADKSFEMLQREKFLYDCSWPTRQVSPGLWPYSLEYASTQDCVIGPCPVQNHSQVWILPMLAWQDPRNEICAMVDACLNLPKTVDGLLNFMVENFNRTYHSNKAPFGFYVHAAWFDVNAINYPAYLKFVDYLQTLRDVYMVSGKTVINWVKNPVPVSNMTTDSWSNCRKPRSSTCNPKVCRLLKNNQEERYMTQCTNTCPKSYPWIENPLGQYDY